MDRRWKKTYFKRKELHESHGRNRAYWRGVVASYICRTKRRNVQERNQHRRNSHELPEIGKRKRRPATFLSWNNNVFVVYDECPLCGDDISCYNSAHIKGKCGAEKQQWLIPAYIEYKKRANHRWSQNPSDLQAILSLVLSLVVTRAAAFLGNISINDQLITYDSNENAKNINDSFVQRYL